MPLHKWKLILTNWINCYFTETVEHEKVNVDSLLTIISHLRENLCLDESKSSSLEANTLEEFILEKFPKFTFENGTMEASTEDDLYTVASLLLFFVCVNSKNVDIKNAMCSKLNLQDQEIILKFSKSLMECSSVSFKDVHSAIIEACGQDTASIIDQPIIVAETPPALRTLHGEGRRLQAALDAERFDRYFLQEELSRTNLKLEKLLKDKEQYKLDIISLQAKISNCCGQEAESRNDDSSTNVATAKLLRQLEDLEERLVDTRSQLDDTVYEREIYKAKVEELKIERDKWIDYGQEESGRALLLAEQLEVERRSNESLKELVTELRQHNHHNGFDTSQLECDDPDASVQSLGHNLSVCNEVCANVVEVQLSEERAKVVDLKKQIDVLQDQLKDLKQTTSEENTSLLVLLSVKDTEIENLKHGINEEIEKQYDLKEMLNNEITKLNNEINELEQKIRDNNDHSHREMQQRMQEIQLLQDKVEELKIERDKWIDYGQEESGRALLLAEQLEVERRSNESLKELVTELRQHNHHNGFDTSQLECDDPDASVQSLGHNLSVCNEVCANVVEVQLSEERAKVVDLKKQIYVLQDQLKDLKQTTSEENTSLLVLLSVKDTEIENLKHGINEEIEKQYDLKEMLNNEINELEQKIRDNNDHSHREMQQRMQEIQLLQDKVEELKIERDKWIDYGQEESGRALLLAEQLEVERRSNESLKELVTELRQHNHHNGFDTSQLECDDPDASVQSLGHNLSVCNEVCANVVEVQLSEERAKVVDLKKQIDVLQDQLKDLKQTTSEENTSLLVLLSVKDTEIENLKHGINEEIEKQYDLKEMLNNEINELEQKIRDNNDHSHREMQQRMQEIQLLQDERLSLQQCLSDEMNKHDNKTKDMNNEIHALRNELSKEQNCKLKMKEDYENHIMKLKEKVLPIMEVRAEYEDKLNRMKAKMKQLYQEQIFLFREKQKEELALLEREVQKAHDKLAESSRAYEEHIKGLTTELWNVGEKFLMKKDEAEWLRRKQVSGSLMSLQHVHSSGLIPAHDERLRPSDTLSLRSLPAHAQQTKTERKESRGLHMSDEEGEVFDNRWLGELRGTPRAPRAPHGPPPRLSELQWRNSLCPPHLKSSYPAETQFVPALEEEDIKFFFAGTSRQRKEVGITAYKKPGPPTPSKKAGRLSATGSELRESLRPEPVAHRKTSTPSRIRALFRSRSDNDNTGTPRSKRLSIFRNKKL